MINGMNQDNAPIIPPRIIGPGDTILEKRKGWIFDILKDYFVKRDDESSSWLKNIRRKVSDDQVKGLRNRSILFFVLFFVFIFFSISIVNYENTSIVRFWLNLFDKETGLVVCVTISLVSLLLSEIFFGLYEISSALKASQTYSEILNGIQENVDHLDGRINHYLPGYDKSINSADQYHIDQINSVIDYFSLRIKKSENKSKNFSALTNLFAIVSVFVIIYFIGLPRGLGSGIPDGIGIPSLTVFLELLYRYLFNSALHSLISDDNESIYVLKRIQAFIERSSLSID